MNPSGIDFELLPEVIDEVKEHLSLLEQDLHRLVQTPASIDLLSSAFRHMHTIKGDFAYCHADQTSEFVHHLENVMQSLRTRGFQCSALVAEALLQSLDQLADMMQSLLQGHEFDLPRHTMLLGLVDQLADARNQEVADQAARHILLAAHTLWQGAPEKEAPPSAASYARALALGKQLNQALALRLPAWQNRAALQLKLVLALNAEFLNPSNIESLTLAVYWHDVGLLAMSDTILQTPPTWKSTDWPAYCSHPELAADWLLATTPDCAEAARIIRQHHQWANGAGFPASPEKRPPHQGAQMLACADLLFEHAGNQEGEAFRRGVLRTVFEANGGLDTRFDAELINVFQSVARTFTA